jgi:hypothetical protein
MIYKFLTTLCCQGSQILSAATIPFDKIKIVENGQITKSCIIVE